MEPMPSPSISEPVPVPHQQDNEDEKTASLKKEAIANESAEPPVIHPEETIYSADNDDAVIHSMEPPSLQQEDNTASMDNDSAAVIVEDEKNETSTESEADQQSNPEPVAEIETNLQPKVDTDWRLTAKEIAARINQQIANDKTAADMRRSEVIDRRVRTVPVEDNSVSVRRTAVHKPAEETKVPDFVQKAKMLSQSAASKIEDGNLVLIRNARIRLAEPANPPIVSSTGPVEPSVAVAIETSEHDSDVRDDTQPKAIPAAEDKPDKFMAMRREWMDRVKTMKQKIPAFFDDTKSELKREALAQFREQHKNSGSLVSQLTKNATLPKPSAEQKRNAYKSFAAAPSHLRDTWLPKTTTTVPATFDVVEKRNSNNDVSPQVFRSKSNVTNPEDDASDKNAGNRVTLMGELNAQTEPGNSSENA